MNAAELLDAFERQDDDIMISASMEERVRIAVDDAHGMFTESRIGGLIRRARLRYPDADLRSLQPAWGTRTETRGDQPARNLRMDRTQQGRRHPGIQRQRQDLAGMRPGTPGMPQPVPHPLHAHARPRRAMGHRRRQTHGTHETGQKTRTPAGSSSWTNGSSTNPTTP